MDRWAEEKNKSVDKKDKQSLWVKQIEFVGNWIFQRGGGKESTSHCAEKIRWEAKIVLKLRWTFEKI